MKRTRLILCTSDGVVEAVLQQFGYSPSVIECGEVDDMDMQAAQRIAANLLQQVEGRKRNGQAGL